MQRLFLLTLLFFPQLAHSTDLETFRTLQRNSELRRELHSFVAATLSESYGQNAARPALAGKFWQQPFALFATFKNRQGQTRGCMGRLEADTLETNLPRTLREALFHDPWHRPIQSHELKDMTLYLSAVGKPQPVPGIEHLSPQRDAALIRSGPKTAVTLPGEAKTQRYLLKFLRQKAGIAPGEPYQLYRLPSVSVEVEL